MKSKFALASVVFIGLTLLLKISGLLRDMVIAYFFGDSYEAGAYLAAFVIPNMFILFLVTGMKNALVPSYIQAFHKGQGRSHLGQVFKGTFLISLVIGVLGAALAPLYIPLLYSGFGPDATQIAIGVAAIYFISILFVGMNAVLEGYFDAENRYSLSTVSQIIVVLSLIAGAFLFAGQMGPYSLAFGYLAGTILSLLFKAVLVIPRKALNIRERLDLPEIKDFYGVLIPVGLTVAVGQINLMIDNIFASYFSSGAVTYVNYAKNLVHFPQAIFGVTIGTIIFPLISKAEVSRDRAMFKRGLENGLTTMFFILLPSVIGMMLLMPNLIQLLYERGAFDHAATMATSQVAYFYIGSVLFFSIQVVIDKGYYSLKKGHLILTVSGLAILLKLVLNYLFTMWIGYRGIPLSSSVMAVFYVGACFLILLRLIGGLNLKRIGLEYGKVILSVLIMAVIVLWFKSLLSSLGNFLFIIVIAVIGAIVYGLCALIFRIEAFAVVTAKFIQKE
ncbi:MAG TPA: murein biosynthesis integral membrane protein MurJ [Bacillales bacterium]|nr:murein biosynthesis integral membrane protein MurJ [Bacillales bacterium]